MIPLHGISLVIQDVTSIENYIPLTNASVRHSLVISAGGAIFFCHIMCYFNYSFSPVISLVNSFIKGTRYDKLRDANAKRLSGHNFAYYGRKPLLLSITF